MLKTVVNFLTRGYLKIKKNVRINVLNFLKKIITQRWNVWKKNLYGCKSLTEASFRRKDPNKKNLNTVDQWRMKQINFSV